MMIYEESFGVIPLKQDHEGWKVFVILHKNGFHWGFPKGKANEGENPLESAKRELEEETGLIVDKLLTDAPIVEHYTFKRKSKKTQKTVSYYPALVHGEVILQPEELADGKWASVEKAFELLTFKEAKDVLKQVSALL